MTRDYDIISDPEANVLYQKCRDVDEALWQALVRADPGDVARRTGARYQDGVYRLPFLNRELEILPDGRHLAMTGPTRGEPEFQLCLSALLYLVYVDAAQLPSRQVSPKEYKGGVVFFQGPHALPTARLEQRFGADGELFLRVGRSLGGTPTGQGDASILLPTYPNLPLEIILWLGDEEFPAQVTLTAPAALERFWALDGIWAWLNVVCREFWRTADPEGPR